MPDISIPFSKNLTQVLFFISMTLFLAVIIDTILRSFIKVPKNFENRRSRAYVTILRKTITIIVYVTAMYFICVELGIDITPLLASASIVGIVVGIGARALIEDLINGFFLLSQDAIAVGDYVKVDDSEGTIEKLGFRTLTIRGDSGELHIIPNGLVKKVINFSRHRSYMSVDFPVKADQDIDLTLKAMNDALKELQRDKDVLDFIFKESDVLGIEEYKTDGKMILRAKLVTISDVRLTVVRKYRYLVKKNFEKLKIGLV